MSARDQMTKMLDQLMGQNRDGEFDNVWLFFHLLVWGAVSEL